MEFLIRLYVAWSLHGWLGGSVWALFVWLATSSLCFFFFFCDACLLG